MKPQHNACDHRAKAAWNGLGRGLNFSAAQGRDDVAYGETMGGEPPSLRGQTFVKACFNASKVGIGTTGADPRSGGFGQAASSNDRPSNSRAFSYLGSTWKLNVRIDHHQHQVIDAIIVKKRFQRRFDVTSDFGEFGIGFRRQRAEGVGFGGAESTPVTPESPVVAVKARPNGDTNGSVWRGSRISLVSRAGQA